MIRQALGWDLHRRFSKVTLLEQPDPLQPQMLKVVRRTRLEHADREAMRAWLEQVPAGTPVAMEGAFGWPWVADLLAELGFEPHLGHPPAIKVLSKNEPKADRHGARHLGVACNHALRWAFIDAAASTVRAKNCPPKLRALHHRLSRGGQVRTQSARVAVARELAELIYVLWKKGEPYRDISSPGRPRRDPR